jgi:phage gpG-like protein
MARISMDIQGGDQLIAALRKLGAKGETELFRAVQATAIEVRGEIVKKYQRGPKTGEIYTEIFRMIGGRPVPIGPRQGNNLSPSHQSSAPGEAPATDTGRLASSVEYKMESRLTATVGSNVVYGSYLEFGTQRIAARPAWRPTIEEARPKYLSRLEAALRKATR